MKRILALLTLCGFISSIICAGAGDWCYHNDTCNDAKWPTLSPQYCNGSRQSPINIVTASATLDSALTRFTFTNYNDNTKFKMISNTGKTIKVTINSDVKISGGGLGTDYDTLQFHLHWGNGTTSAGSEHTVDGKRFAMELHIVHAKSSFNGNTTLAVADPAGLAALGFFIEASSGNDTDSPESWKKLTSYLSSIETSGSELNIDNSGISLNDLLNGVDLTKYYRYNGSLTTPACNEAVVWTVFTESIKISRNLLDKFGTTVRIGNNASLRMVDVFRNIQPNLKVTKSAGSRSIAFPTIPALAALLQLQLWA